MFIVKYRKLFFALSGLLVGSSLLAVLVFGLNLGIDFTGGSLLEARYENNRPATETLDEHLLSLDFDIEGYSLRESGQNGVILRSKELSEDQRSQVMNALSLNGEVDVEQERFTTIGPVVGQELQQKSLIAISSVVLAIILYIAFVFRKVSRPVSSWKYGLVAILALIHDIAIPVGVAAILGVALGMQIDVLFVMALLAILGFSVNDTIVVFDRVRENLKKNIEEKKPFFEVVGRSLNQTYVRSINTSFTTLIVLVSLYVFAGGAISNFVLTLIVGVIAGTYSSIFLASPLLVTIAGREKDTIESEDKK